MLQIFSKGIFAFIFFSHTLIGVYLWRELKNKNSEFTKYLMNNSSGYKFCKFGILFEIAIMCYLTIKNAILAFV